MVYHKIRRHGQTFYQAFDPSTGYYETNTWTEEALIAKQLDHTIDREVEIHDEEAAKTIR
ncbi:hypothetical protein [Bacillus piscicola]|uniref:hypothetical protein n=1 Tax=Bacillus piscicola TaxID=1632684 RepID=UPI001F093665|nr:hypothetical protein [Bacillus piscicola]